MKVQFLSNVELLSRFGKLVQTERKITHLILECIAEIDARKLYLEKAYPSIYELMVEEFGYSSSAAVRRIESARLLREVPGLVEKIESGALNLSQLSKVQQAVRTVQKLEDRKLDVAEKTDLLSRIEFTTQQQTEVILSQALSLPFIVEDKERVHRDESVTLTITFTKEQIEILTQAQDLIAHAVPEKKWSEAITYLAQKEIQRRTKVREFKNADSRQVSGAIGSINKETQVSSMTSMNNTEVRSDITKIEEGRSFERVERTPLSLRTKKMVLKNQNCCQYKNPATGKICGSKRFLQIDHRHSVWAGGSNDPGNLQILCAEHNRFKYRTESGIQMVSHP